MYALAGHYPGSVVNLDSASSSDLAQEFEQRLADCSTLAFRVALGVLRNRADAEDVAQEAFVRAYQNFSQLRDRERFRAWIARIAWRLAIDRWRATGRRERRELAGASEGVEPAVENLAGSREFQRRLADAIDALPERLRRVVLLSAIQGYNLEETSKLLGLPIGTVKSRLHHARKQLAEKLRWTANVPEKS